MIFLTVGTHEPFDRLVEAIDKIAQERPELEFFGQITHNATFHPAAFETVADMLPDQYEDACARADLLVAHAGMGTIITALKLGKPIVMLPRRARYGETRNDHQVGTASKFAAKPGIYCAMDVSELGPHIDAALQGGAQDVSPMSEFAEPRLLDFLKGILHDPG